MLPDTEESEVETMAASPGHTPELKQRAVGLCLSPEEPACAEVGRKLGVDAGSIAAWAKAAAVSGDSPQADANPFQMAEDPKRLRRDNARLERENEILLKAGASSASKRLQAQRRRRRDPASYRTTRASRCAPPSRSPGGAAAHGGAAQRTHMASAAWSLPLMIGEGRGSGRGACGPPKIFRTLRRRGVRTSRKRAARIVAEYGRHGVAGGNASTEPLMGVIESECVHARTFATREEATVEIFGHVERFYSKRRTHSALGWLSPDEFESEHGKRRSEAA